MRIFFVINFEIYFLFKDEYKKLILKEKVLIVENTDFNYTEILFNLKYSEFKQFLNNIDNLLFLPSWTMWPTDWLLWDY